MRNKENDNLHAIFATLVSQTPQFIRNWLKLFMLLHKAVMMEKGKFYLSTKKLSYEQWLGIIEDGHKGDVLALYGLSMLTEVHAFVHLHDNQFWCTMKKPPNNYLEAINRCAKHLLYLGCGLFT